MHQRGGKYSTCACRASHVRADTAVAAVSAGLLAAITIAAMPVLLLWLCSSTRRSFELMPDGLSSSARPLPGNQGALLTSVLRGYHAELGNISVLLANVQLLQECNARIQREELRSTDKQCLLTTLRHALM